jgi:RHS repeat-associated protein
MQSNATVDEHGYTHTMVLISNRHPDIGVVRDFYPGRTAAGYTHPGPLSPDLEPPVAVAIGPGGVLHALWIRYKMFGTPPWGYLPNSGSYLLHATKVNGVWSALQAIMEPRPRILVGSSKMEISTAGIAHVVALIAEGTQVPEYALYGVSTGFYLAYMTSAGGYQMIDGTQADPVWAQGQGAFDFRFHLLSDSTKTVVWASWFLGRTLDDIGWFYNNPHARYIGSGPSTYNIWADDLHVADQAGNDHVFGFKYLQPSTAVHIVNNVIVENIDIPANVGFGKAVGVDSRGQIHVIGNGSHWVKRSGGWVYGRSSAPIASPAQILFGRNDEMIIVDGSVRRSITRALGVRDPLAHAQVMPGGSVDLTSGNFHYALPLFSAGGVGPCQAMTLCYNSLDNRTRTISPGWKLNYEMYLNTSEVVTLTLPDGRPVRFLGETSTKFIPVKEDGFSGVLERLGPDRLNAEHKLTTNDGTIYLFNQAGKLRVIQDPSGNFLELLYDVEGYLTQVIDMLGNGGPGRTSVIEYEPPPDPTYPKRISKIVDPSGSSYRFTYNGWNLASVTFEGDSPSPSYGFTYSSRTVPAGRYKVQIEHLDRITTPLGGNWEFVYLPDHRVASVSDPEGALVQITYDETVPQEQPRKTFVKNRRGFTTEYILDAHRSLALEIRDPAFLAGQRGIFPIIRTFDAKSQMTDVQDRWGKKTTFEYRSGTWFKPWATGMIGSIRRPNGSGAEQEDQPSTRYVEQDQSSGGPITLMGVTTVATPIGGSWGLYRRTSLRYDDLGAPHLPTSIAYPDVSRPDGVSQSATRQFEYGGPRKQVTRMTNEEGHSVVYSNFDPVTGLPRRVLADGGSQPEEVLYNRMGNMIQRRVPQGGSRNEVGISTTAYDGLQRPTTMIDATGAITTLQYDVESHVTTVIPPVGGQTTTAFDARGFMTGGSGPEGVWSQSLDPHGNVLTRTDVRDQRSTFSYDFAERMIESKIPGGSLTAGGGGGPGVHVTQFSHDEFDGTDYFARVIQVGAPANRVTTTTFDNLGRPKRVLQPDNLTKTETVFDEQSQALATQLFYGASLQTCTLLFRDARDRIDRIRTQDSAYGEPATNSSDRVTLFNRVGSPMQIVDPLGDVAGGGFAHKTTFLRDARERMTQVIDGKGVVVRQRVYGDDDLPVEEWEPDPISKGRGLVRMASYEYTARKELKRVVDRNNGERTCSYNALPGEVARTTDPLGRVSETTYDSLTRRPVQVIEALGTLEQRITRHVWRNGLLTETRVFNPESGGIDALFRSFHDAAGRLERREYPAVVSGTPMAAEQIFYNDFGEVRQIVAGAKTTTHSHDARGLLVGRVWSGPRAGSETRTYNGSGLSESVSNSLQRVNRTWNLWNQTPLDEIFSVGGRTWKIQTTQTDVGGNVTGLLDGENQLHEWPVDENNRQVEKRLSGQGVSELTYTPGGLVDTETLKNSAGVGIARTTHSYEGLGRRVRSATVNLATGETVWEQGYSHNVAGEVTKVALGHLATTFELSNDGLGRVQGQVTAGNSGGTLVPPFDNVLVGRSLGNESRASDEARGRPRAALAVAVRRVVIAYDPSGNWASQTVDGVVTTYEHNGLNQLVKESSPERTVRRQYDDLGNQRERKVTTAGGTVTESFDFDAQNLMSVYANSSTGALWQYDYWPEGERYAKTDLVANEGELYIPRDGDVVGDYGKRGSAEPLLKNSYVQGLGMDSKTTRVSGSTRRHYLGDGVGTVGMALDDTGEVVESVVRDAWGQTLSGSSAERYGFAQREHDSESGLVFMRHRMYDPTIGRFTQTDPIRGNRPTQHYAYAGNNPISNVDPMGDVWKVAQGPGTDTMLRDLEKYTGRRITVDGSGTATFAGSASGKEWASSGDTNWINSVQNDSSNTDITGLWRHIVNGDQWHRDRFADAWSSYSGQQTGWQAFDQGGAAGLHGFAQGATFGGYQAPPWAQETPGFWIAKGIGTTTVLVEAGLAGGGAVVGFGTSVSTASSTFVAGVGSLIPATATAATGTAAIQSRQHIVLGLRAYGLERTVQQILGTTHLLNDPSWKATLMNALGNASSRITVVLDGFAGSNVREMVMRAAQRGATPVAAATEWEVAQIFSSGRLADVTLILNNAIVANPFK